jgi:DNA-directed RNA polymerase subunit K/omega
MEALRVKSSKQHPEVVFTERADVLKSFETDRKTLPYLSKYEYTAVLASRKNQLANGAKPMIALDGLDMNDPLFIQKVAEREILERKLPFLWVCRRMPDDKNEYWAVSELELAWTSK